MGGLCLLAEAVTVDDLTDHDWDRIKEARSLFPEATIYTVHVWDIHGEIGVKGEVSLRFAQWLATNIASPFSATH